MQRRKFLTQSLKSTLVISTIPSLYACTKQRKDESSDPMITAMISEIEMLVPDLLKTNKVPAFSIALVHAGKLAMLSPEQRSGFVMFTNSDNGGYVVYNEALGKILNRLLPKEQGDKK